MAAQSNAGLIGGLHRKAGGALRKDAACLAEQLNARLVAARAERVGWQAVAVGALGRWAELRNSLLLGEDDLTAGVGDLRDRAYVVLHDVGAAVAHAATQLDALCCAVVCTVCADAGNVGLRQR